MSERLARWADRHGWMPFARGTDGLTGRQRRGYSREFERASSPWPPRGSAERAVMFAAIRDDPNYPTTYATRCNNPDHCDRPFHYSTTRPQR